MRYWFRFSAGRWSDGVGHSAGWRSKCGLYQVFDGWSLGRITMIRRGLYDKSETSAVWQEMYNMVADLSRSGCGRVCDFGLGEQEWRVME